MPQPLSRVRADATIFVGIDDNTETLPLWRLIMFTVNSWSHIDALMAEMLGKFLKADHQTVFAMYSALSSGEAKRAAFLGAAKSAAPDDFNLIEAAVGAMRASRHRRNAYAHHLWGYSPELPDALLLFDPDVLPAQSAALWQSAAEGKLTPKATPVVNSEGKRVVMVEFPQMPSHDRSKIFVYKKADLEEGALFAEQCVGVINLLKKALGPYPDEQARSQLLSEPLIQRALERRSNGNAPPAPPPPPASTTQQ